MVVLGLGSNLGDRLGFFRQAKQHLESVLTSMRCSSVYESLALLPEGAPKEWDIPFYNMAIAAQTTLSPQALLYEIKKIEQAVGRQDRGRWGPREIDIDILVFGSEVISSAELTIPHAGLLMRDFAIVPLADVYPAEGECKGKTAAQLAGAWIHSMEMLEKRID